MTRPRGTRREPPSSIDLPSLTAAGAADPRPGADYEAIEFADLDLGGRDATGGVFLACRIVRCDMDGLVLARARLAECLVEDARGADVDLADGTWRDTILDGARIGAMRAAGATWDDVRVRASRANLLDLRGARLANVVLEDCVIDELDLGGVDARWLRLERCVVERLVVDGARLADVDLSGARLGTVQGIDGLRGATLDTAQLLALAPQLAAFLGIRVR